MASQGTRALDLGCGASISPKAVADFACGLDVRFDALRNGMGKGQRPFICGQGEKLPFCDCCFDMVISEVAIPYMDIPQALTEIKRVLRSGGSLRLSLHPVSMTIRELFRAIRQLNLKNTVYRVYILANGAFFSLAGRQFHFPLKRSRCESFQTVGSMTRALAACGFIDIRWEIGKQFIVLAEKPSTHGQSLA
jgi:ubiquinone/menaquinone biosynthesis C-methylase UbiE